MPRRVWLLRRNRGSVTHVHGFSVCSHVKTEESEKKEEEEEEKLLQEGKEEKDWVGRWMVGWKVFIELRRFLIALREIEKERGD